MIDKQKEKMIDDFCEILSNLDDKKLEDVSLDVTELDGTQSISLDVEIKK